jgi:hypothetical protein
VIHFRKTEVDMTGRHDLGDAEWVLISPLLLIRGRWRTVEVLACLVTWLPHPQQIEAARHGYKDWWQALGWIREALIDGGMLRTVEVTGAMPKRSPWLNAALREWHP